MPFSKHCLLEYTDCGTTEAGALSCLALAALLQQYKLKDVNFTANAVPAQVGLLDLFVFHKADAALLMQTGTGFHQHKLVQQVMGGGAWSAFMGLCRLLQLQL